MYKRYISTQWDDLRAFAQPFKMRVAGYFAFQEVDVNFVKVVQLLA